MPARYLSQLTGFFGPEEKTPDPASERKRREVAGSIVVLTGLFLFVSLLAGADGRSLVGEFGQDVRALLQTILGAPVAFLVPAAVVWLGVELFLGRGRSWSAGRVIGIFLSIWAVTGLLALPGADDPNLRQETVARAGVMGAFLVEWEGLRLVGQFGVVGAAMIMAGMLVVGAVLTTNLGLTALAASLWERRYGAARTTGEEDEAVAVAPANPRKRKKTEKPAPEPEEEPAAERREAPALAAPVAPRRSLWKRMFAGRRRRAADGARVLGPVDEPEGWEDPLDDDVAAAARALEEHEWEQRFRKRLSPGAARRAGFAEDLIDTQDEEEEFDEFIDEEEYEDEDGILTEDEEDYEFGEEEDSATGEEDEIVFKDHSGPLPITKGNPGNAKVGEGLAKLFPSRWPKEGTPAEAAENDAEEEEGAGGLVEAAEARMLRRTSADDPNPPSEDPLFTEDFDTRPYGPNGERLDAERLEVKPEPIERGAYTLPDLELLNDPPLVDARMTRDEVVEMSQTLVGTLADFGVEGKVTEVHQGPVVTRFEFRPAAGIKVSRIVGLEQDLAMAMKAISVRILAPIPGKNAVGIEVPNKKRQGVYLKELISCEDFWESEGSLTFALGKTIDGSPYFADLAKMPHLLIAGATGAGKSVCLNTIICSLLYTRTPDEVKLIMVDPKRVELSVYGDIPHLLAPVVCEPKAAAAALNWAVEQMEERYKKLVEYGVRNIDGYNRLAANPEGHAKTRGQAIEPMPYMVIVVDELADLMLVAKADVEESIQRLAQMARAVGIHLILATQRPSVNVITGIIKANFPSRIAFQVSQKVDSRTILDANGAEALLGRGDMLFSKGGAAKPIRIQGAFLSDEEVEHIADWCRNQWPVQYEVEEFEPKLSEKEQKELARMMGDVGSMDDLDEQDRMVRGTNRVMGKVHAGMFVPHDGGSARAGDEEIDEALVRAAARLILETRKASVSLLQRRLKVGFARAGRLMDMLEEMGIVGEFKGSKPRDIVVDPEAALSELDRLETALDRGKPVEEILAEAGDPRATAAGAAGLDDVDGADSIDEGDEDWEDEPDDPNAPWPEEMRER